MFRLCVKKHKIGTIYWKCVKKGVTLSYNKILKYVL